jgi:hypothetical protein
VNLMVTSVLKTVLDRAVGHITVTEDDARNHEPKIRGLPSLKTCFLLGVIVVVWGPERWVYCSLQAYCTYPMCVQCSHFHRQGAPRHNDAGDPNSEMWKLDEKRPAIWPKVASSTLL